MSESEVLEYATGEGKKGKEDYLYCAFIQHLVWKCSDMDHTVLRANYTIPTFPS